MKMKKLLVAAACLPLALMAQGDRLSQMHIHFSKIEYTNSGERRHLTFADEIYGPQMCIRDRFR